MTSFCIADRHAAAKSGINMLIKSQSQPHGSSIIGRKVAAAEPDRFIIGRFQPQTAQKSLFYL
jgi:hypothetical protein